jgi:hypothetical protein
VKSQEVAFKTCSSFSRKLNSLEKNKIGADYIGMLVVASCEMKGKINEKDKHGLCRKQSFENSCNFGLST